MSAGRALSLAVLVLAACGDTARVPVVDLLADFRARAPLPRVTVLDAATAARSGVLDGHWSAPALDAAGKTVVWMEPPSAALDVELGAVPPDGALVLRVVMEGTPRHHPGLVVRLAGRPAGRARWRAGAHEVRVPLREHASGRVRLTLRTAEGAAEADARIGLLDLRLDTRTPPAPMPALDGDRLVIPAGATAEWFVAVPDDAELIVRRSGGALAGRIEPDAGAPRALGALDDEARVGLDAEAGRIVRLALTASGDAPVTVDAATIVAPAPPPRPEVVAADEPWNLVVYVADTLRADRLQVYGYARPTSPRLAEFAADGIVFERAVAQASWTRPTVGTLLTGRLPLVHGAVEVPDRLRDDVPLLAELLRDAGWSTAAFVTNLNASSEFGFARGFERFEHLEEAVTRPTVHATAAELNAAAFPWLDEHSDEPFYLHLHATDPHAPYRPAPADAARFLPAGIAPTLDRPGALHALRDDPARASDAQMAELGALYDGDVRGLDAAFGALLDRLDGLGVAERTLVVFVADHGEELRDHGGLEHGHTLFDELVRVPLVLRLPAGRGGGRRVTEVARQLDVLPTVLGLLGVPAPADLPGAPLVDADGTPIAAEAEAPSHLRMGAHGELGALVFGNWKAIVDVGRGSVMLFDVAADPYEQRDVAAAHPVLVGHARHAVERMLRARRDVAAPPAVDADVLRRLETLGYFDVQDGR